MEGFIWPDAHPVEIHKLAGLLQLVIFNSQVQATDNGYMFVRNRRLVVHPSFDQTEVAQVVECKDSLACNPVEESYLQVRVLIKIVQKQKVPRTNSVWCDAKAPIEGNRNIYQRIAYSLNQAAANRKRLDSRVLLIPQRPALAWFRACTR